MDSGGDRRRNPNQKRGAQQGRKKNRGGGGQARKEEGDGGGAGGGDVADSAKGKSSAQKGSSASGSGGLQKSLSAVSHLSSDMRHLSVVPPVEAAHYRPMKRPDRGGGDGSLIELISNHFDVKIKGKLLLYLYDVEFEALREDGRPANRRLNRECRHKLFWEGFVTELAEEFPRPEKMLFDQSKLLCSQQPVLPVADAMAGESEETVMKQFRLRFSGLDNDQNRDPVPLFRMTVTGVPGGPVNVGDLQSAYRREGERDNVLKQSTACPFLNNCWADLHDLGANRLVDIDLAGVVEVLSDSFSNVGRNFYYSSERDVLDLGGGREIRRGFYQAVRTINNWKTAFTLDVKAGVFYKVEGCVEVVKRLSRNPDPPVTLSPKLIAALEKEIKGLKLKVTHIGHKITCSGLSPQSALTAKFVHNGREVTVDEYFREVHNRNLKYKQWPLVMKGRNQSARLFPLEVCEIADRQRVAQKKVTNAQQAKVVDNTVEPPDIRYQRIINTLEQINHKSDGRLKEFGVSVNMTPIEPKGRILEAPGLQYKSLSAELLVVFSVYCHALAKCGCRMGVPICIEGLFPVRYVDVRAQDWINGVETIFMKAKANKFQLLLVILDVDKKNEMDNKNAEVYAAVKKFGEQTCNVVTQCVKAENVNKVTRNPNRSGQLLANVCLKINAKLGGTNMVLKKDSLHLMEPFIFFGADVTHPDPGDKLSPSIAGIAVSQDNYPAQYIGFELVQKHRQEWIEDLGSAVKAGLMEYYKKCRAKPSRIIFYRDGVSEGQFTQVLQREMHAVQQACLSIEKTYNPGITFIIVQKRHNTRLFRKHPPKQQGDRRVTTGQKNIPPGTTVDTEIVHPEEFDFYLSSHEGIQGTSKPTHYHVLYDDNKFTSNSLQRLTYYLCHTYARCTRSSPLPQVRGFDRQFSWWAGGLRSRYRSTSDLRGPLTRSASPPLNYRSKPLTCSIVDLNLRNDLNSDQTRTDVTTLSDDEMKRLAEDIKVGDEIQKTMYWQ